MRSGVRRKEKATRKRGTIGQIVAGNNDPEAGAKIG